MAHTRELEVSTSGEVEVVDLTEQLREVVAGAGVDGGLATIFVTGSTAAITTIEHEPGLAEEDLPEALARLFPRHGDPVVVPGGQESEAGPEVARLDYGHERRWGDGNGHSHVRASFLGPSLTVPVVDGEPTLGTWQQVVLVELDNKPRDRRVVVQVTG